MSWCFCPLCFLFCPICLARLNAEALNDVAAPLFEEFPEIGLFKEDCPWVTSPHAAEVVSLQITGKGFHRQLELKVSQLSTLAFTTVDVFQRLRPEIFADPFELQNTKHPVGVNVSLYGSVDLETPAPGSPTTLLHIHLSQETLFPVSLSIPLHIKYQAPVFHKDLAGGRQWSWIGPYASFSVDSTVILLRYFNADCQFEQLESNQWITVPSGNLSHCGFVLGSTLFLLILNTLAVIWYAAKKSHTKRE